MPTIKVSPSAASVIETDVEELAADPTGHGLDAEEARAYQLVMTNLKGDRLTIPANAGERKAMSDVFSELSNIFDDYAEYGGPGDKKFNRSAAKSLASISIKLVTTFEEDRQIPEWWPHSNPADARASNPRKKSKKRTNNPSMRDIMRDAMK